jgi:membrane associated rhomboid family serine protease
MHYDGPRFSFPALTPAIRLLLLVNGAVFLANAVLLGRLSDPSSGSGGFWFAFSWSGLLEGWGLGVLRLLTYQFTHSFRDPMHLLVNLLVLYFFGTMAEQRLGARGVVRLYLAGGAAGALVHLCMSSLQGEADVPLIGASGACYGFLLYATCMAPRSVVFLVFVPVPLWGLTALLVGIGAYSMFVEFATGFAGGVSHGAHLGGAALGALAHRARWFIDRSAADGSLFGGGLAARWRALRSEAKRQREERMQHGVDEILAKVKQSGIGSLSAAERRQLERASAASRGRSS